MTNVVNLDFGFRDPNGYDADERFDLRQNALLMSVNWQVDVLREVAIDLFMREGEVEMHTAVPLFDVMGSIYRDILMPATVTSDLGLRRARTIKKNFSTTCFHFPLSAIKEMSKFVDSGEIPTPPLQVEVAYIDYDDDYTESEIFHTVTVDTLTLPDNTTINKNILNGLVKNVNSLVEMNGGFSKGTVADDGTSPALIGFIPYSEVQYIRISLVISELK